MNRDTTFMRTAARIGDLSSPFYDEERRRDVWNEASAVGFQLQLWLGTLAATVAVWTIGEAAVPVALAVLGIATVSSAVVMVYAARLGVEVDDAEMDLRRLTPYLVLLALFVVGLLRAGAPYVRDGFWGSFRYGMAVGAVLALIAGAGWFTWHLVRDRRS